LGGVLPLQPVQYVNINRVGVAVYHYDDSQTYCNFGSGQCHDKKHEHLPGASPLYTEKAVSKRLTELSINSTDMKITIALRRINTPITPIAKMIVLNNM
jgi:hypothetical protein